MLSSYCVHLELKLEPVGPILQIYKKTSLTVTLRTGSTEPMTPKYAFMGTKRLQIGKMFQETPPEI